MINKTNSSYTDKHINEELISFMLEKKHPIYADNINNFN